MKMFSKAAALGTTAIMFGLLGTAGAYAQGVEQITITAQKREATLQDTPVSVAAVSEEQIEQSQIRDSADLQTLVPSLRVAEFATATNTEFSLRGIGTSSFNVGLEPSVGVFVDGVYRPRTGAAINDLLSIERVEVIRGPQSTLFGRNTPAGVVSFITQKPEYDFGYVGEVTLGNYGQRIARGSVTGPISDTMAFRLDASTHTNTGYLESTDGREINNRDRQNYRGQLLWNPTDNTEVRIIADRGDIDENCCAAPFAYYDPIDSGAMLALGGTVVGPDPWGELIALDGDLNTTLETSGLSVQVDHDFDSFAFTSITSYREYDENQIFDADFSDLDLVSLREIQTDYTSFTQEFRLTSTGDNDLDWMVGAFYYDNNLHTNNTTPYGSDAKAFFDLASAPLVADLVSAFGLPAGTGGISLLEIIQGGNNLLGVPNVPLLPAEGYIAPTHGLVEEDYQYDTTAWSAFAQFDWHITDRMTLTVGGRYSDEDKEMVTFINQPDPISELDWVSLGANLRVPDAGSCLNPADGSTCAYLLNAIVAAPLATLPPADALAYDASLLATFGTSPLTDPLFAFNPLVAAGVAASPDNPLNAFTVFQNFPPVSTSDFPDSRNDSNFSGNIILSYDVSDTLNVYGSYSTGYKPGGFNVSTNAAFTGFFEFEEETSASWEFGAKGSLGGGAFRYATAVFFQEIEDFQSNNFVGNGFALENAGSIEVSGLEFEAQWAPTDNLFFTGGFTYLFENKYGEYTFAPCPDAGTWDFGNDADFADCEILRTNNAGIEGNFNNFDGRDRGNSDFVGSLTATYTGQFSDTIDYFLRGEATYVSEFLHTTSQDPRDFARQDDFTLFNASFGFGAEDESWGLQFWGRNIFDEEYTKGGFPSVGYLGNSYNVYPGDPQTYGVTLRIRG